MQHGHSPVGLLAFEYTTRYNLTAYIPVHYYNLFLSSIAHIVFRALLGSYINYTMHFCLHTRCIKKVNNYTIAYKSNMQLNFRRFFFNIDITTRVSGSQICLQKKIGRTKNLAFQVCSVYWLAHI